MKICAEKGKELVMIDECHLICYDESMENIIFG